MLKGKVAVVTGSTSGIGLGIARALASGGADLMINGFGDNAAIEKLRQEIAMAHGVRVAYSAADLSKPTGGTGLIEHATRELGRVDVLVNNAGICNAICPGWVLTPLVEKQIDALAAREKLSPEEARVKLLGEKQPSLDFAIPEQLGALATFLCSDAAAQLNGAALPVDGGWLAR